MSRWRRQELEYWPLILREQEEKFQAVAQRWWFKLYGLIHLATKPSEDKKTPKIDVEDVQKELNSFMETSNFGEFPTRLGLIHSFYMQCKAEDECGYSRVSSENFFLMEKIRKNIINILSNVHSYYVQFLPLYVAIFEVFFVIFFCSVQDSLEQKRSSIIKELNDKIKLGRWEDRNYYRLKETAEKSHRKIAKIIRDYTTILQTPIQEVLTKPFSRKKAHENAEKSAQPNANASSSEAPTAPKLKNKRKKKLAFDFGSTLIRKSIPPISEISDAKSDMVSLLSKDLAKDETILSKISRIRQRAFQIINTKIFPAILPSKDGVKIEVGADLLEEFEEKPKSSSESSTLTDPNQPPVDSSKTDQPVAHRVVLGDVSNYLGELCRTIIDTSESLKQKTDAKSRPLKKRAFVNLLNYMKENLGLVPNQIQIYDNFVCRNRFLN